MKKFVTLLLAVAMVCAMSLTALASGSPDTSTAEEEVKQQIAEQIAGAVASEVTDASGEVEAVVIDGASVEVNGNLTVTEIPAEAAGSDEVKEQAAAAAAKIVVDSSTLNNDLSNVEVDVWTLDATATGAVADAIAENKGVQLTLKAPGIKADYSVKVLHKDDVAGWEEIPVDAIRDDAVVATFKSLSPIVIVAVYEKAATPAAPVQPAAPTEPSAPTSPETGDVAINVVIMLAVVALGLSAVTGKKVRSR